MEAYRFRPMSHDFFQDWTSVRNVLEGRPAYLPLSVAAVLHGPLERSGVDRHRRQSGPDLPGIEVPCGGVVDPANGDPWLALQSAQVVYGQWKLSCSCRSRWAGSLDRHGKGRSVSTILGARRRRVQRVSIFVYTRRAVHRENH